MNVVQAIGPGAVEGITEFLPISSTGQPVIAAYAAIAFLLCFVARHSIAAFAPYRGLLGVPVLIGVAVS